MTTESTEGIRKPNRRWQSDVIVDLVKHHHRRLRRQTARWLGARDRDRGNIGCGGI
jgi:hypothetical protein